MARELLLSGHRYWILSEPHEHGWKAWVEEVRTDQSGTDSVGIEATADTRGGADSAAERKLRRLLQLPVQCVLPASLGRRDGASSYYAAVTTASVSR